MLRGSPRPRLTAQPTFHRRRSSGNLFWPCSCQLRKGDRRYGATSFLHDSHGLGGIDGCRLRRRRGRNEWPDRHSAHAAENPPICRRASGTAQRGVAHRALAAREAARERSSAVSRAARVSSRWRRWVTVSRHAAIGTRCMWHLMMHSASFASALAAPTSHFASGLFGGRRNPVSSPPRRLCTRGSNPQASSC